MKTILVDAIHCYIEKQDNGSFLINKEMHTMLESFQERKILLTGSPKDTFDERQLTHAPYTVFSLEQDPPKANPEYYKIMLQYFQLTPDEVVHFEHNQTSIQSAEAAGITTYFYDNQKKDIRALQRYIQDNV